jgi:hypothetical protein
LIEHHILNKKLKELNKLVLDYASLVENQFKKQNVAIDMKESLSIFSLILEALEAGDVLRAYTSFLYSFDNLINFRMV